MHDTATVIETVRNHVDREFYRRTYMQGLPRNLDEAEHYVTTGAALGHDPSPEFSTTFYLTANPDIVAAKMNPLWHYVIAGRAEGRLPRRDPESECRDLFDAKYYLETYPDIAAAGVDPYKHFANHGWTEGRNPAAWFSTDHYRTRHGIAADQNPLRHYALQGREADLETHPYRKRGGHCVQDDIRHFSNPSPQWHEVRDPGIGAGRRPEAKAMALYLPQFHPIAENDRWWGKGFTEWRNVGRGTPRFAGHYQPRIPEELGHYDLRDKDVMARQVEMAREAGLEGFCFYYYWFNGQRVLEKPLDMFLENADLDLTFSILWANENWTRRWDGFDQDVLLKQDYRPEDDEAFMADLCRYFRDPRYLRVKGRPLFIIYRPGLIPDARNTIARWRMVLREKLDIDPWFFMTQGFGDTDPREYGLDGAMEFPPHKVAQGLPSIISDLDISDLRFSGNVVSYDGMAANAAAAEGAPYPLLRGVTPSWDNDARRQGGGTTYHGSTPAKYQAWLTEAVAYARSHPFEGDPIVFINAWNEWAEAAYLEPDVHYGAAYLNATARALNEKPHDVGTPHIALVTHDAHPHGAQLLVKNLARVMTRRFGIKVSIISLGEGPLLADYRKLAPTHLIRADGGNLDSVLSELRKDGCQAAIVNTTVSGRALPMLRKHGFFTMSLVHELPRLIREYGLQQEVRDIAQLAHLVVFPARQVQRAFSELADTLDPEKCVIRPQGSYLPWQSRPGEDKALRDSLGLGPDDKLVINVGYADARKGFDIFLQVARHVCATRDDVHFAWIGATDPNVTRWILADIIPGSAEARQIHMVPFAANPVPWYQAADLFFLSSREDPFPTVVLEAFTAGLPVIGLEDSGGSVDVIAELGALAPRNDPAAIADRILHFLDQPADQRAADAGRRRDLMERRYRFETYANDLVTMILPDLPRVSVVIPNYRYAEYLPARLDTVFDQSCPLFQTLVLDDASPDDSLSVLARYRRQTGREFDLVTNEVNSGSGYAQWDKGARMCTGDLVWIAEADDLAEPDFLEKAQRILADPEVAFVFCDSSQRDQNDVLLSPDYGYYFDTVEPGALTRDFVMEGPEFVKRFLSVKNLILNVSSVVWRREALVAALDATRDNHLTMKVACDWKMYAHAALHSGKVGFVAQSLNMHRRHSQSVTHSRAGQAHFDEIVAVQDHIARYVRLPANLLSKREAYRQELRVQFGLIDETSSIDETVT